MTMFIEVNNIYNGEKEYVFIHKIVSFGHNKDRNENFIWFGGGDIIYVNESVEEIKKKINEVQGVLL